MNYERYMRMALQEAERAREIGEVPIGALVVQKDGRVIGKGHNLRETTGDPTAHAEIIAIRQAAKSIGGWRLSDCVLFSTLEPCPMCAGAIIQSRIEEVVYGTTDPKAGCVGTLMNLVTDPRFNHRCTVVSDVLQEECSTILTRFFRELRNPPPSGE